jgi:molybdenum cofactor cytidylyltransferase
VAVVGILLAAGRGVRFGGDKLLAPLPRDAHGVAAGTAVGVASALHARAALGDVVVVVRPGDVALEQALAATRTRSVGCERADEGMGASLACGVIAASDADGWVVALGDMPWIAPATIAAIADALRAGAPIVAPVYRGRRGHPVGFAKAFGPALAQLTGDEGARAIVRAQSSRLQAIDVDDAGVVADVDCAGDLR